MTTRVPQSCTLPTMEQPLRVAAFDALFAERLAGVSRPDRLRLELVLAGGEGVEETVRDLGTWWLARRRRSCSCAPRTAGQGGCSCPPSADPLTISGMGRR
ncbi:hypothetical protein ACPCSF_24575 [Streptomyces griseoincarnatus]